MFRRFRKPVAVLSAVAVLAATLFVLAVAPSAEAGESISYTFRFVNGKTLSGVANDKTFFLADAGGSSADNPTGMTVHLSCSDEFTGGWGDKDGPVQGVDTAWQIDTFFIEKGKKTCGTPTPPAPPPDPPNIDIEKFVNGQDADDPTGPQVNIGETVMFSYEVTNTGGVPLRNVEVTDSVLGPIQCPKTELAVGESMSCSEHTETVTAQGQFTMKATVTGVGDVLTPGIPPGAGDKDNAYRFTFVNGITIVGVAPKNEAFLPDAGGTSVTNPTGMTVHVSCSDEFPDGWGKKDGPVQGVDTAWQIASFSIAKLKKGEIDKTCGDPFAIPTEEPVMDMDPVYYIVPPPSTTTTTQPTTTTTQPTTTTTQPTTTTIQPTTTTTRPTTTTTTPPGPPLECVVVLIDGVPKVSWNSVNAEKYEVWRNNERVGATTSLMLTDFNAPVGKKLTYRVVASLPDWNVMVADCGKITIPKPPDECTVFLKFYNHTPGDVRVNWVADDGQETTLGSPWPGQMFHWEEFIYQEWKVRDENDQLLIRYIPRTCGEHLVLVVPQGD